MSAKFHFELPKDVAWSLAPKAPVSILDHDLAVIQRTTLDQPVSLEPGVYAAKAVLPDGSSLEATFRIEDLADHPPVLLTQVGMPVRTESPGLAFDVAISIAGSSLAKAASGLAMSPLASYATEAIAAALAPASPKVSLLSVDCATGQVTHATSVRFRKRTAIVKAQSVTSPTEQLLIRVQQSGAADLNIVAPVSASEDARIVLDSSQGAPVEVCLENSDAEIMLRYLCSRRIEQVASLLGSEFETARKMLQEKFERPIAAVVGAYALILVGPPKGEVADALFEDGWFDRWTANLAQAFPFLIDPLCIRAEVLARQGQHAKALAILKELPNRGLPMFSFGLRILLDRLSSYRGAAAAGKIPGCDPEEIEALLRRELFTVAAFTDFDRPLLTFTTDPTGAPGMTPRTTQFSRSPVLDYRQA